MLPVGPLYSKVDSAMRGRSSTQQQPELDSREATSLRCRVSGLREGCTSPSSARGCAKPAANDVELRSPTSLAQASFQAAGSSLTGFSQALRRRVRKSRHLAPVKTLLLAPCRGSLGLSLSDSCAQMAPGVGRHAYGATPLIQMALVSTTGSTPRGWSSSARSTTTERRTLERDHSTAERCPGPTKGALRRDSQVPPTGSIRPDVGWAYRGPGSLRGDAIEDRLCANLAQPSRRHGPCYGDRHPA